MSPRAEAAAAIRRVNVLYSQLAEPPTLAELGWHDFRAEFDEALGRGDLQEARSATDRWRRFAETVLISKGAKTP